MIELMYESDGLSPFGFEGDMVTGLQVFHQGMFVQILEGPEADVWAAFDTLGGTQAKVMKTEITRRSLRTWNTRLTTADVLPVRLTNKLVEFAAIAKTSDAVDADQLRTDTANHAVTMLTGMADTGATVQTIASGPFGASLSGRTGNRAWVAV